MSTETLSPNRLPEGGRIDRNQPIEFTYDKRKYIGYLGDTVASALLAADRRVLARSYKYHRPRGLMSASVEEPSAIISLGSTDRFDANMRATMVPISEGLEVFSQTGYPSPTFDFASILGHASRLMPPGFYYKTFMRPKSAWRIYEKLIRKAASQAKLPSQIARDRSLHRHEHCDLLIVGGGIAGVLCALALAKTGISIILAEQQPHIGGVLLDSYPQDLDEMTAQQWFSQKHAELMEHDNVRILVNTTVTHYLDYNYLLAREQISSIYDKNTPATVSDCLWRIRAKQVLLATGTIEQPMLFQNNDNPRVMTVSALSAYHNRFAVLPGKNLLFYTNNDSVYPAALAASAAGRRVEIVDTRNNEAGHLRALAKERGIIIYNGYWVNSISGGKDGEVTAVSFEQLNTNKQSKENMLAFDSLAVSGGFMPTVHLFSQSGGRVKWDAGLNAYIPDTTSPINNVICAGSVTGIGLHETGQLITDCNRVCEQIAKNFSISTSKLEKINPKIESSYLGQPSDGFIFDFERSHTAQYKSKCFVDFMNDVSLHDLEIGVKEGYDSIELIKRYTVSGLGTDQGKLANLNVIRSAARILQKSPGELGHTTFRPPYVAVPFGVIAGIDNDNLFAPERYSPMHSEHLERGAAFEDVGEWKRPWYFPLPGEDIHTAVERECKAARNTLGLLDSSTLGKIAVHGRDAGKFLDYIYTNMMSNLPIGKIRYGLMLTEHGMIFDDGVCARISEFEFLIMTTTGGAARVMNWLNEWLQTEWPHFDVYLSSLTDQLAICNLVGPNARTLLASLTSEDISNEVFGFMTWRNMQIAGVPARVWRVSFSGELSYEIHVPARYGLYLWRLLLAEGEKHEITPYGTETLHVLRAEKGFIIVGQDTDGTRIPADVGLGMLTSKQKDFLGKRSLARPDCIRDDREQLVGLVPVHLNQQITEGAIVSMGDPVIPVIQVGYVSSSYFSPSLNSNFALAFIKSGRSLISENKTVWTMDFTGKKIEAKICSPVFIDNDGKRMRS